MYVLQQLSDVKKRENRPKNPLKLLLSLPTEMCQNKEQHLKHDIDVKFHA